MTSCSCVLHLCVCIRLRSVSQHTVTFVEHSLEENDGEEKITSQESFQKEEGFGKKDQRKENL